MTNYIITNEARAAYWEQFNAKYGDKNFKETDTEIEAFIWEAVAEAESRGSCNLINTTGTIIKNEVWEAHIEEGNWLDLRLTKICSVDAKSEEILKTTITL